MILVMVRRNTYNNINKNTVRIGVVGRVGRVRKVGEVGKVGKVKEMREMGTLGTLEKVETLGKSFAMERPRYRQWQRGRTTIKSALLLLLLLLQ